MSNQPDLFAAAKEAINEGENRYRQEVLGQGPLPGRPRLPTPATQRAGLVDVAPRMASQNRRVLELLERVGPLTRNQIAEATKLPLASVCRVVAGFLRAGLVAIDGAQPCHGEKILSRRGLVRAVRVSPSTQNHRAADPNDQA